MRVGKSTYIGDMHVVRLGRRRWWVECTSCMFFIEFQGRKWGRRKYAMRAGRNHAFRDCLAIRSR